MSSANDTCVVGKRDVYSSLIIHATKIQHFLEIRKAITKIVSDINKVTNSTVWRQGTWGQQISEVYAFYFI